MDFDKILAFLPMFGSIVATLAVMISLRSRMHAEKEFVKAIEYELETLKAHSASFGEVHELRQLSTSANESQKVTTSVSDPFDIDLHCISDDVESKLKALEDLKNKYFDSLAYLASTRHSDSDVIIRALNHLEDDDRRQINQTLSKYTESGRVRYLETVLDRVAKVIASKGKVSIF